MSQDFPVTTSNFLPMVEAADDTPELIRTLATRRGLALGELDLSRAASLVDFLANEQRPLRSVPLDLVGGIEPATALAWINRGGRSSSSG